MKMILKIIIGLVFILGALFLYLPPIAGIPCLGWWKDLVVLIKGSLGGILFLIGLIFFAIAKD